MNIRWSDVVVEAGTVQLEGAVGRPEVQSSGLVIFAHGSGNSRKSPGSRLVADRMVEAGLAVLLFDLLTPEEEERDRLSGEYRFDIAWLSGRLILATDWALGLRELEDLGVGYFGASTGGAAAIVAAASLPDCVRAVVCRSGRPDLAGNSLEDLMAPTLLIVGGADPEILALNQMAYDEIQVEKDLAVIEGATHLFDEPGSLERAAELATDWFLRYLPVQESYGRMRESPTAGSHPPGY